MRVGFPCSARGRVLLIALPVVLLLGGGAAYFFFFLRPSPPKAPPPEETFEYELTDLTVNLADQDKPHYLSASVGLVITGPEPEETVEQHKAQICDAVIMAMTQHTYQDLLSA
ncbi:MAG: flagellar basal body-associated FliL family protein, partial [Armatimonadota bacterium]